MIKEILNRIANRQDLTRDEMISVMREIMEGRLTSAQIAAFITALKMKGETEEEITGAAIVMREKASKIPLQTDGILIDTCGTGGDGAHTFNISTTAAFVAAGCGIKVAKHGNRSVSSKCGSADVLEELGVKVDIPPEKAAEALNSAGIGFLFAPVLHQAMKHAVTPRREIGIRTIFNLLGPLTNPAGARYQLIGVYDGDLTEKIAHVLKNLGTIHAFVVHGSDGLDEITMTGNTKVSELKDGVIKTYHISPEEYGFKRCRASDISGGSPKDNAKITREILSGEKGHKRDIVILNAAFALSLGGRYKTIKEAISAAEHSIDSGRAKKALDDLIAIR